MTRSIGHLRANTGPTSMRTIDRFFYTALAFVALSPSARAQRGDSEADLYLSKPPTNAREKPVSKELEAAIRQKEAEARKARGEAIRLLEQFLQKSATEETAPEALYKLAELYWEDAKGAFLARMGIYQAALTACHNDHA